MPREFQFILQLWTADTNAIQTIAKNNKQKIQDLPIDPQKVSGLIKNSHPIVKYQLDPWSDNHLTTIRFTDRNIPNSSEINFLWHKTFGKLGAVSKSHIASAPGLLSLWLKHPATGDLKYFVRIYFDPSGRRKARVYRIHKMTASQPPEPNPFEFHLRKNWSLLDKTQGKYRLQKIGAEDQFIRPGVNQLEKEKQKNGGKWKEWLTALMILNAGALLLFRLFKKSEK